MTKCIQSLMAVAAICVSAQVLAEELPPPQPAVSEQFSVGQVWRYRTRPGEEGSRVIIGKIEQIPEMGTIVHVKLIGLSLKGPAGVGTATVMNHAPVSEAQVSASVTDLTEEVGDLDGFTAGYETWLSAFRAGKAGVFTL